MSEEYPDQGDAALGPLDQTNPVPFALLLDDNYRRQNISSSAYEYVQEHDPQTGVPQKTTIKVSEPDLAAIYSHALSPQNNLMDYTPPIALAKKLENDILFQMLQLKYRRTKHHSNLAVAQVAMNQTIDGMSTEGTFSVWLTRMTGSIREVITGIRRTEE